MKGNVDRRLTELERVAAPMLGFRYFGEKSGADPIVYEERATGQAFTLSEIDALSAAGWQCTVIGEKFPKDRKGVIRMTWGDSDPLSDGEKPDEKDYPIATDYH